MTNKITKQEINLEESMTTTDLTSEKSNTVEIELGKYKIDKAQELQQMKLNEASNVIVGKYNLAQISLIAEKFAKAGNLIPREYQNEPEKCFVAIYKGASLGIDAFTSLQRIAVVNGRATVWGDTALALVRNSGELEDFHEEIIEDEGNIIARCTIKRKGDKKEKIQEFTQKDAIKAGLWNKSGSWTTHPKIMLKYKARAFALRDIFPDVIDGLYLKEEMEGENIRDITPQSKETPLKKDVIDQSNELFN